MWYSYSIIILNYIKGEQIVLLCFSMKIYLYRTVGSMCTHDLVQYRQNDIKQNCRQNTELFEN